MAIGSYKLSASAAKTYLNPGEETAVVAHMDTSRFFGVRSVTITVQLDRPTFADQPERGTWAKMIAGNTYEHYEEHIPLLHALASQ